MKAIKIFDTIDDAEGYEIKLPCLCKIQGNTDKILFGNNGNEKFGTIIRNNDGDFITLDTTDQILFGDGSPMLFDDNEIIYETDIVWENIDDVNIEDEL